MRDSKWNIDSYRVAVQTYRNAQSKEQKREMEKIIQDIKTDFRSEINANDPKVKRLQKVKGELFLLTNQTQMFEMSKKEKAAWNKKFEKLSTEANKLEAEIREIKDNKIYENAFEWRFEFPEVLNEEGDYVGFDVVIGNPPYVQLSKTENLPSGEKEFLLGRYKTSGGRLNTFIFFTHLSSDLLKINGILNFIIPNTILSQEYYSFTRDFLTNVVSLNEIVGFPLLPFEDAVVETVLIQYSNVKKSNYKVLIKQLKKEEITTVTEIKTETINRDSKFSFVYSLDPIVEKAYSVEHVNFGEICDINQGIALKGDKSLSLKKIKEGGECYKLLDGRNINKYKIDWDGVYLNYDLKRIHSCKRKDIFQSNEKLFFRRVSSSLIFAYDDSQYFALNTLIVVNKKNRKIGPDLKFILGLMNSKLMNYIYTNKFKSTKTVFSEIQARSMMELPICTSNSEIQNDIIEKVNLHIIEKNLDAYHLQKIDRLVYELYGLTEEEIAIVENS